jgi:hypothetical protein
MNNDKLICIRDEDDTKLITLLSEGWRIIQISASDQVFIAGYS